MPTLSAIVRAAIIVLIGAEEAPRSIGQNLLAGSGSEVFGVWLKLGYVLPGFYAIGGWA